MAFSTALWGGFSSFFSIWQVCILQISPFFMLYILGLYLVSEEKGKQSAVVNMLLPSITYTLGFSIIYALLSARGIDAGRMLVSNINNLRIAAGVFIGIISLQFILALKLESFRSLLKPVSLGLFPPLLGVSFALIYSPCVTPTYASILQIAVQPETARQGATLAWGYGLGMGLSFSIVGMLLVYSIRNLSPDYKPILRNVSGVVLGILAIMNITGVMVYYKAFFLGLLV